MKQNLEDGQQLVGLVVFEDEDTVGWHQSVVHEVARHIVSVAGCLGEDDGQRHLELTPFVLYPELQGVEVVVVVLR